MPSAGVGSNASEDDQGRPRIRVLYVDDDPTVAETAATRLERALDEATVVLETDPEAVLDRLETEFFDCVVSDYRMARLNGVELLRRVAAAHGDLPFILFTGKGSEAVASEAISAGVTGYVRKEGGHNQYAVLARQVEAAVEHRRAVLRFERFLESAPDAIAITDTTGTITRVNEQLETMFGYDRDDLVGEPIEVLIPERYRDRHVEHREAYLDDPETRPMGADIDLYALQADGSEFPVDISLSPVQIGDHVEVMAAVRDISTRKWREEKLRERQARLEKQNQRLDEFASVVSHDVKNLLMNANTAIELAAETGDRSHFETAQEALDRMAELVEDLLTLAREGQTVEDLAPVSLEAAARGAWHTLATSDATLVLEDADVEISADKGRMRQLLENLFHNALQHADEDVTVTVGFEDGTVFVADDGPGIPPDEREDVFDYGYSTRADGTGYGLAIVRSIVQAHGWRIRVTASAADGARFEITRVDRAG